MTYDVLSSMRSDREKLKNGDEFSVEKSSKGIVRSKEKVRTKRHATRSCS